MPVILNYFKTTWFKHIETWRRATVVKRKAFKTRRYRSNHILFVTLVSKNILQLLYWLLCKLCKENSKHKLLNIYIFNRYIFIHAIKYIQNIQVLALQLYTSRQQKRVWIQSNTNNSTTSKNKSYTQLLIANFLRIRIICSHSTSKWSNINIAIVQWCCCGKTDLKIEVNTNCTLSLSFCLFVCSYLCTPN